MLALVLLAPTPPSAWARSAGDRPVRLSDEKRSSRWAYAQSAAMARRRPDVAAPAVGRLRYLTSSGQALPYLALQRVEGDEGWTQVRLPTRRNDTVGWVPNAALGPLHRVSGRIVVDRSRLRVTLFDGRGDAAWSAPAGIGRHGVATPRGRFVVTEKLRTRDTPAYGPFAIATSAYAPRLANWPGGGVVALHGTDRPDLVPGRPSHGCVRLRNDDVTALWRRVKVGTPVLVR